MMSHHEHTIDCYAKTPDGGLAYTPCRADGLDRHKTYLPVVDFWTYQGSYPHNGLTLVCDKLPLARQE
jgi:hypothetical protein